MPSREEMIAAIEQELASRQAAPQAAPKSKEQMLQEALKPADYGAAMNNALSMLAGGGLSKAIPKLGGLLGSATEGATLGAAQAPEGERLKGAAVGGASQGAMSGLAKLLGKTGDVAMQVGVGRKKYTPGVGTELADQGLIGTRGMMRGQVEKKLGSAGEKMQQAAAGIPEIDARVIGKEIGETAASPYTGGGVIEPSARDVEALNTIKEFASDVSGRGAETGPQALARRRAAGSSAYSARSDLPKQNLMSQLSKAEQQGYSSALKSAGGEPMQKADASYAALKKAQKSLGEEASLSGLGLISRPVSTLGGAALATGVGQAGVRGGKLAEFLAPITRQAATGGREKSASQQPSREEMIQAIEAEMKSRQGQ